MAHEIFGSRFLGIREPAWHSVGTVIQEDVKASEAVQVAGLDYGVEKVDLFLPDGMASGYSAVIRQSTDDDPVQQVFGVAKDYELVHITDIVDQLDNFPWPVSSAGALRRGAEIFITYDLGDRELFGEDYKMYLAVAHPYAPGTAWRAMLTPVRVVCSNTLVFGDSVSQATFAVKHHTGARARIDEALVLSKAAAMEERAYQALEHLKATKITKPKLKQIMEITYPVKSMPMLERALRTDDEKLARAKHDHELRIGQTERIRAGAVEVYNKFNEEHKDFAGSGYALYQAVCEWADWREGRGGEAAMAESSLIGSRSQEKRKAFKAISDL